MKPLHFFSAAMIAALLLSLTVMTSTQGASPPEAPDPQPGLQSSKPVYLHLAWQAYDPLVADASAKAPANLRLDRYAGDGSGYYILQFEDVVRPEQKAAVEALGVQLYGYLPDFAFIVRADSAALTAARSLPGVRWAGMYQPAFRIEPHLLTDYVSSGRSDSLKLMVSTFPGEDISPVVKQLESWGGQILEASKSDQWEGRIKVQISAARIADIANVQAVEWVEQAPEWKLLNNIAADIMAVRPVWNNHGLYGSTQIVGISDTGLDQGSALPANLHLDFQNGGGLSRVLQIIDRVGDGASDVNSGHGTHVAGSVLGNGARSGSTPSSHTYPNTAYVGMAPEARLVFQAVENNTTGQLTGIPADLNALFAEAYNAGARIHTNSWGSAVSGVYDSSSQGVDQFSWANKDFAILFAAGNEGVDTNSNGVVDLTSLDSPGTAKNSITVGASESIRPGMWGWNPTAFPVAPIRTDDAANNPNGMAAFSSRGYTLDGRVKPDIVAPGTGIASTRSSLATGTGWGSINTYYMYMGGTSMATPLTAGAAALVREYFTKTHTFDASAALIKAALLNGATDIYPGQYGTGATQEITMTRPGPQEGWGRVNLETLLFPAGPRRTWYWDTSPAYVRSLNSLSTGQVATYTFSVTQSAPLSITLAWTDYPGTQGANGALVNDLDLKVVGPTGTAYYSNNPGQRGPAVTLGYDDGPVSLWDLPGGSRAAVRFTPTSYPASVDRAVIYVYATSYPVSFSVFVWDATGPGSTPGTQLFSTSVSASGQGWLEVPITGVNISSGDFYIGMSFLAVGSPNGVTDGSSTNARSYYYNGASWISWAVATGSDRDLNIRARVTVSNYATQADRVNNVEGIDIANPTTGVYTLTVSGYNVPQGPQPYALVLSGIGRLLGSETLTRTIPVTGTYEFGNTGATLNFSNKNLNNVAVTVYRDRFPSPDQTNSVKRFYVITSTGGTGAFTATLSLAYEQDEVPGGLAENTLQLFRWGGSGWVSYTSTVDVNANIVTAANVNAFSTWAMAGPGGPTSVNLSSFDAKPHPGHVFVEWKTANEVGIWGYNLERAESPAGERTRLNSTLIPSKCPGCLTENSYEFNDVDVVAGRTYYYWIEIVGDPNEVEGPASATALYPLFLPSIVNNLE